MMLKRDHPDMRVLIVERTTHFDRKVGESTSEVAGCFPHARSAPVQPPEREALPEARSALWFCKTPQDSVDDLTEIGPRFQSRLATFQLDRSILDEHLLKEACDFGCELMRPPRSKRSRCPRTKRRTRSKSCRRKARCAP
jgi:hypothetical protein